MAFKAPPSRTNDSGVGALDQPHALFARVVQLVLVAAHVRLGAAVEQRHVGHAEPRQLARGVDRGVAAADHHARADAASANLGSSFMRSIHATAPVTPAPCRTGDVEQRVRAQAAAQEHGVVVPEELLGCDALPHLDAGLDRDRRASG
jgi:hypothetical protein